MSEISIKQIFQDHWTSFLDSHPVRPVVYTEVEKMLECGNPQHGYSLYYCELCQRFKVVPFRCKSRFCNTCGAAYQSDRADSIASKLVSCKHRHIVFTIPQELRSTFYHDRSLLDVLIKSSAQVILDWFSTRNRKEHFRPGIVCCIHTFGRDLKWNPHIHMLLSEGACGNSVPWKDFHFFPYSMLRKRWQTTLLYNLELVLGKDHFRLLKDDMYSNNEDGFYVNASPSPSTAYA